MTRLTNAWRALGGEQRLAAVSAGLLFLAMFLPWYQQNAVVSTARTNPLQSQNLDAFAVFSFVEAAVLLVAAAVLFLLFARAERRAFWLPGGDGTVVLAAGVWVALLLVLRLFDKPGITRHGVAANVGVQWGIFFALAAAGLLAYAGSRMRSAQSPDPPLERRRAPTAKRAATEEDITVAIAANETSTASRAPAPARPRYPPAPPAQTAQKRRAAADEAPEQLSFEDHPGAGEAAE